MCRKARVASAGMVNMRERAIFEAAQDIWNETAAPVSAEAIGPRAGFDEKATQLALRALHAKGYFGNVLTGDDRIVCIADPIDLG
jgi:hypothetical protein